MRQPPIVMDSDQLTFAFSHRQQCTFRDTIPIAIALWEKGLVVALSHGAIRVYDPQHELLTTIDCYRSPHLHQQLPPMISLIEVYQAGDKSWVLVVGYTDGVLAQYSLPSGNIIAYTRLSFTARQVDALFSFDSLLVWGHSSEMVLLEKATLAIQYTWDSLPDWPFPVPLFDDSVFVVHRSGQSSMWHVPSKANKRATPKAVSNSVTLELGTSQSDIIAVRRVGPASWLVVQPEEWSLFRWEDENMVKQISSGARDEFVNVITDLNSPSQDECFGIISRDDTITWVSNSNAQLLEPAWDPRSSSLIGAIFDSSRSTLVALLLSREGLSLREADVNQPSISWSETNEVFEQFSHSHQYCSGISGQDIVVAHDNTVSLYTLPQFLDQFRSSTHVSASLEDLEDEHFTIVESSIHEDPDGLVALGTSHGRLVMYSKDSGSFVWTVGAVSAPVGQILRFPAGQDGPYSESLFIISRSSTIVIALPRAKKILRTIPGNNVDVNAIYTFKSKEEGHTIIQVQYENDEERFWNLDTNCEVLALDREKYLIQAKKKLCTRDDEAMANGGSLASLYRPITFGRHSHPNKAMTVVNVDWFIDAIVNRRGGPDPAQLEVASALLRSLILIPKPKSKSKQTAEWQSSLLGDGCNVDVGQVFMSATHTTVSTVMNKANSMLSIDGYCAARLITAWSALAYTVTLHSYSDVSFAEVIRWLLATVPHVATVTDFASLCISAQFYIVRKYARACLREIITMSMEDSDNYARELLDYWSQRLPVYQSGSLYSQESAQALEIVVGACLIRNSPNSSVVRMAADSLQMFLSNDAPVHCRNLAVELIGRGWLLWQNHFNPYDVTDRIISIMYSMGYLTVDIRKPIKDGTMMLFQQCLLNIAKQNITLLISALLLHLSSHKRPLEVRVTAVRILSSLVASGHITPEHLPTIVSAVVKILDPSDASLRNVPPNGSSSLITEGTQFLSTAMAKYPGHLAFHKGQQRLAVSAGSNSDSKVSLLALVYDLRTGTVISTLGLKDRPQQCTGFSNMSFSSDGRQLAATVNFENGNVIALWKVGATIISFLPFNNSDNDSVGSVTYAKTEIPTNTEKYRWTSEGTIEPIGPPVEH